MMEWIIVFVEQIGFGDLITGRKRGTMNPNKIKNPNKVMALILGEHWHKWEVKDVFQGWYKCADCLRKTISNPNYVEALKEMEE